MLKDYNVMVEPTRNGKFYPEDLWNFKCFDTLKEAQEFYERVLRNYKRGLYKTEPYMVNLHDYDYVILSDHTVCEYRWASFNGEKVVECRYIGYPWNNRSPWLFRVSTEKREYWDTYLMKFKVYVSNVSIG